MSKDSDDLRRIINLLESNNSLDDSLEEGPRLNRAANRFMAKLGSNTAKGRVQRDNLAKPMISGYKAWLGRTNRKGTLSDVQRYLGQIGFTADQTQEILNSTSISQPQAGNDTEDKQSDTTKSDAETPTVPKTDTAEPPASSTPTGSTSSTEPEPAKADHASVDDLKARKQASLDKMNFHDVKREKAIAAHDQIDRNDELKKKHPELQDRMKALANHHRDQYNVHRTNYNQSNDALKKMGYGLSPVKSDKLAASKKMSGNKLMELNVPDVPLSSNEVGEIFTNAAAFAHDNDLVRSHVQRLSGLQGGDNKFGGYANSNTAPSGNYASSNYGGTSYGSGGSRSNVIPRASRQDDALVNSHQKIMSSILKQGVTEQRIQQLQNTIARASNVSSLNEDDVKTLAVVGFSFLKNL